MTAEDERGHLAVNGKKEWSETTVITDHHHHPNNNNDSNTHFLTPQDREDIGDRGEDGKPATELNDDPSAATISCRRRR